MSDLNTFNNHFIIFICYETSTFNFQKNCKISQHQKSSKQKFSNSTLKAGIKSVTTTITTSISSQVLEFNSQPQFSTKSVNFMNTVSNKFSLSSPVFTFAISSASAFGPSSPDFQNEEHEDLFFVFDSIDISEIQDYLEKTFD